MVKIENDCVGCPPEMGCMGGSCLNCNVKHYYCDNCGCEDKIYYFNGQELCLDCIEQELEEVSGD